MRSYLGLLFKQVHKRHVNLNFREATKIGKIMGAKQNYPSAERNKIHILEVLKKHFDNSKEGKVLELASGTGQQASYFASFFPKLEFQPTECDTSLFESIKGYARETSTKNVHDPIKIDVAANLDEWNIKEVYDYIICVNMIHVTPYECSIGLFQNGTQILKPGGLIITYGAYAFNGAIEPQSNIDFDKSIRRQNPTWGLRDITELEKLANHHGIVLLKKYDLPSNNKCLVWQKN